MWEFGHFVEAMDRQRLPTHSTLIGTRHVHDGDRPDPLEKGAIHGPEDVPLRREGRGEGFGDVEPTVRSDVGDPGGRVHRRSRSGLCRDAPWVTLGGMFGGRLATRPFVGLAPLVAAAMLASAAPVAADFSRAAQGLERADRPDLRVERP